LKDPYRVSRISIVYRISLLVFLTLIGGFVLYILVPMEFATKDYLVVALLGIWVLALLRYWIFFVGMPYRITCLEGDRIRTKSLLGKREIPCKEIQALRISPFYPSFLKIVTQKRNLTLLSHIDGLHELVSFIKEHNPELETRGC
jgi:hypothetical protein